MSTAVDGSVDGSVGRRSDVYKYRVCAAVAAVGRSERGMQQWGKCVSVIQLAPANAEMVQTMLNAKITPCI